MVASSHPVGLTFAVNSTALPPGSICGQRCVTSPAPSVVSAAGLSPDDVVRSSGERASAVNAIVPSPPQDPPRALGASASVTAAPPLIEIFLSLLSAKNPSQPPSAEKNTLPAPSVPDSGVDCNLSNRRRWIIGGPAAACATNAMSVPSGDRTAEAPAALPMASEDPATPRSALIRIGA